MKQPNIHRGPRCPIIFKNAVPGVRLRTCCALCILAITAVSNSQPHLEAS